MVNEAVHQVLEWLRRYWPAEWWRSEYSPALANPWIRQGPLFNGVLDTNQIFSGTWGLH